MMVVTNSEKETIGVGKKFAGRLKGGEVVLLVGDLGAGKTTFVKGVAAGLGYKRTVTSPTFVIMKVYEVIKLSSSQVHKVRTVSTIKKIVHVDTYRGLDVGDLENIGVMEYWGREDCVSFVEWGAGLEGFLKENGFRYFVVRIKSINENKREIEIK